MTAALSWELGYTASVSIATRERLVPRVPKSAYNLIGLASREILPAAQFCRHAVFVSEWYAAVAGRILELSRRPAGWDSYGGSPLQYAVVLPLLDLLQGLDPVIQSEPSVSLTGDGGLVVGWQNDQSLLNLTAEADPAVTLTAYFQDSAGVEWEGPIADCHSLEKWVWQASSPV